MEVSTVPQQEPAVFRRIGAEGCKERATAGLKQACTHYGIFLLQSGVIQDEDHDWLNDAQLESIILDKVTFQRYADYLARFALSLSCPKIQHYNTSVVLRKLYVESMRMILYGKITTAVQIQ
jgi:hypothetical protein